MTKEYDQALAESWISGVSSDYIESTYESFLQDPESVDPYWRSYFQALNSNQASIDVAHGPIKERFRHMQQTQQTASSTPSQPDQSAQAQQLVESYRRFGHQYANSGYFAMRGAEPAHHLSSKHDVSGMRSFSVQVGKHTFTDSQKLDAHLKTVYCGSIGFEYMYVENEDEQAWLQSQIESYADFRVESSTRIRMLDNLYRASELEKHLGRQHVGQKRFSLEGGDLLIGLIEQMLWDASSQGYLDVVIGMAHRGRLNVMVNTMGMSSGELEEKFRGSAHVDGFSGDVKYHLGYSCDRDFGDHSVHLALAFNPSHLEAISPVCMGNVRARLDKSDREQQKRTAMALILHGDASVAGQGVVAECLNMAYTDANNVDGSIHVVVNNQIGFTTIADDARSSRYCTDVAKSIQAPVLHLNGDDPDAAIFCAKLATEYKKRFNKDIFIDLVCYRRHGHNEGDEPSATQPLMYQMIKQHEGVANLYEEDLKSDGTLDDNTATSMREAIRIKLKQGEQMIATSQKHSWRQRDWQKYQDTSWRSPAATAVPIEDLTAIGRKILQLPTDFTLQKQVQSMHDKRVEMVETQKNLNWGMAEMLAYATLLEQGFGVRMQGQDCCRGTFAHRHAVYHDQKTGATFMPLRENIDRGEYYSIYNSVLSEYSALGYEYGYAETDPNTLVIWEAQFGDFANNAQVIIDQFIASGWQKWSRMCGLVMLLPHGYEGMGPEHSSARLERFLQLCAQENFQVCTPTLPAQYFHMIRRQKLRAYRRPLIVMSPKSLLRNPMAVSSMQDLAKGEFQLVIPNDSNSSTAKKAADRLVICAGKIYYDLKTLQIERKLKNVHILRIEQLYPFPYEELTSELAGYHHLSTIYWCQEEPMNQGSWFTLCHRIEKCLGKKQRLEYIGREKMAAPASGDKKMHDKVQLAVTLSALGLEE